MRWRLFERFKQRVKRFFREHVHFVKDVHLVAPTRWQIAQALTQITDLVNAAIRRPVNLNNVKRRTLGDFKTGLTHIARDVRSDLVRNSALWQARVPSWFCPPHACQQRDKHEQYDRGGWHYKESGDVPLLDHVIKRLGAPFARCNLVPHTSLLQPPILVSQGKNDRAPSFDLPG